MERNVRSDVMTNGEAVAVALPRRVHRVRMGIVNRFPSLLLNSEIEFTRSFTILPKEYHVTVAVHGIGSIGSPLKISSKIMLPQLLPLTHKQNGQCAGE